MEKFSVPVLFTRIFIPAAFLLVLTFSFRQFGFKVYGFRVSGVYSFRVHGFGCQLWFLVLQVCIVHLHYFHEPFLQLTDLKTVVDTHNSTITRYHRPIRLQTS